MMVYLLGLVVLAAALFGRRPKVYEHSGAELIQALKEKR